MRLDVLVERVADRLDGGLARQVEMRDLAQRMDAGIGAAGAMDRAPPRRRTARPPPRGPAAPKARSPGAASRRGRCRHIRASACSGAWQDRAGREREAAQEGAGARRRRGRRAAARSSRSAPSPQAMVGASSSTVPGAAPGRPARDRGSEQLDALAPALEPHAGRRVERAHRALERRGRMPPVEPPFLAPQLFRIGRACLPAAAAARAARPRARRAPPAPGARRARPVVSWSAAAVVRGADRHASPPAAIGPVSSPSSICMMVTPVSASPASSARSIGAAPRQRGSSEAWTLRQPRRGAASTAARQDQPIGRDHRGIEPERGEGGGLVGVEPLGHAQRRARPPPPHAAPARAAAGGRARPAAAAGNRRRRCRGRRR